MSTGPFYPSLLSVVSNARLFAAAFCLQQERRAIFGKDTQNVWRGNKYWSVPFRIGKHYNAIFIAIDHLGKNIGQLSNSKALSETRENTRFSHQLANYLAPNSIF